LKRETFERIENESLARRLALSRKKGADYATEDILSNFRRMARSAHDLRIDQILHKDYGIALFYALLKIDRFVNLALSGKEPSNEALLDTWDDLKNYIDFAEITWLAERDPKLDLLLKRKDIDPAPPGRITKPDLLVAELPEKFEVALRMVKKLETLYALMDSLGRELSQLDNKPEGMDDVTYEARRGQLTKRFLSAARASTDIEAVLLARAARETAKTKDLFSQTADKIKELKAARK